MLRNYLKIAFRNVFKNKSLSIINILGLAISVAVCFMITLFIIHELSYDTFHHDSDDLYRIIIKGEIAGQTIEYAVSMAPLPTVLSQDYPEVEAVTGIFGGASRTLFSYNDINLYEADIKSATGDFFNVFDYELLQGSSDDVLTGPNTIVLSETLAKKIFGDNDPVGETITLNQSTDYIVTGVFADFPTNSHLNIHALTSVEYTDDIAQYWGSFSGHNYVRLKNGTDPKVFEENIRNLAMDKMGITKEQTGMEFLLYLEPVKDIHLYSTYSYNLGNNGSITHVYVFSIIAFFILVIAYINFINLTTAHYSLRAKEIGVRKIVGASRDKLISQFLLESVITTFIATIVALIFVELLQPVFNQLTGIDLHFNLLTHGTYLAIGLICLFFMALLSGFYPAIYLSGHNPILTIKGCQIGSYKKSFLRNILVVFQFVISIALICCTGIIYKQTQLIQHKKLGFDKEHVLIIPLRSNESVEKAQILKDTFLNTYGVTNVSVSSNYPGSGGSQGHGFFPEGYSEEQPWLMSTMGIDADFIKTFGLKLKAGRNFSADNENEGTNMIVNETLVKEVGWEDPIGKTLKDPFKRENEVMKPITIIGVVEDFHVNPLQHKIEPMVLNYEPQYCSFISLRLEPGNIFRTIDIVEKEWKETNPCMPFDYYFLDEQFDRIHRVEKELAKIFMYFTTLAILIACLGLFGLASYATERRIKEIGVRKVLGSSVGGIILLLSKDFSKLVLIANIIAWPIGWYAMNKWLQSFAYRTNIGFIVFLLSGLIALIIALLTVSFKTLKAARANPVKSLKYE